LLYSLTSPCTYIGQTDHFKVNVAASGKAILLRSQPKDLEKNGGLSWSRVTDRSTKVSEARCIGCSRDVCNRCLCWFLWGKTKVDLDFFYLASFDGEELRIPGAAAVLGCAIVEDEGFVAFKHLLNTIRWGVLAVGPAPFEIGFTVNAIVVWTGKYEVIGQ
jgi:hypothetical protein